MQILDWIQTNNILATTIRVCTIILLTVVIAKIVKIACNKRIENNHLFVRFAQYIIVSVVYVAGILGAIGQIPQLNTVVKTILAGSGILALAISLSAQESLNNIISGFFIIIFKPFEIGDRVTLVNSNITGTIEDVTLRHTVIKTFINSRIVIPNSTINKEIIENSNLIDSKASSFIDVSISYESDTEKAMAIMARIIGEHPKYIDVRTEDEKKTEPKVRVYVRELGTSAVMLRASMWTKTVSENFDACSDVRLEIKKEFEASGIDTPYNKVILGTLRAQERECD